MSTSPQNYENSADQATNAEKVMHLPGSIIDNRYQIIQKLGRSETYKTYLAKDLQAKADARCIVEQLNFEAENEASWQIMHQYLLNEVSVLYRLGDHPQIPQFYEHFVLDRQFYLVREYIDGNDLEQEVKSKKFDEAETIYLVQDGLRVLDFVHKTNVIHRNVQPIHLVRRKQDNIYVLINFGAIREIEATEINLQGELIHNNSVGNWVYAAPEQKEGEFHFSSDIYALAKSAVYALTGRSPQELEQTHLDWRSQCQISDKFESILARMMSPIVERRYHSALEVLQDLRPLLRIKQLVGGRYSIAKYLGGQGGTDTYLADNLRRQYQSPCTIKQIELPHSDDGDSLQLDRNFAEELSVLERLGYHEQIPQLWDHFEEEDRFYLVQEYIQGKSLAEKIAEGEISVSETVRILESALSVLEFIHQNRIIHCNIKPSNVLIREVDRQVIVADFGILNEIKTLPNISGENHADRQNYWSPEQKAGRPTISSDLYALGMTAIETLTGRKPVTIERDESGKLPWSNGLNLERRLVRIIDKLIQQDLGQRYQSAGKVLSELQRIDRYDSFDQSPADIRLPNINHNPIKRSSFPLLVGLLGIFCLLGSIEFAFPTVRPSYYWHRGQKLLPEQPETALSWFGKTIDLKPQSWRGWLGRGDSLFILERYPQALEAYIEAAELNPNNAESWKKQGDVLFSLEKFSEAIAAYNKALELDSENPNIYNKKGQALSQLQQYEAALVMHNAALERDRLNPQFLSDRAKNLFELGRYEEALGVFNRVQAIEPDNIKLWQNKFLVLEKLDRPKEATRLSREINNEYIKLIQQKPQEAAVWIAQGDFFASAQMLTKAVESYDQAIGLKPDDYEAWFGKGQAFVQQSKSKAALAALNRALQLRPTSYRALQSKGRVYRQQFDFTQALTNYNRAIEISPDNASLWLDRGIVYNQQRNYTQGISSLTQASELNPYNPLVWQELVKAWLALRNDEKALATLNRAIQYYPQDSQLWSQRGSIYTRNGQYNEACDIYRQARRAMTAESSTILSSMRQLGCRMN